MFKFYKSMRIYKEDGSDAVVYQVGLKKAWAEFNHNDQELYFSYYVGLEDEYLSQNIWDLSAKGLETAIWEWLCTLSRWTTPDGQRTLGKLYLARQEAA